MATLTGSANFLRYLLFFFNFLFVITGIILLSIGLTVQGVYIGYEHFLDTEFFSVPALLIAIGIIIFIIAFFGCWGAYKENYCMILTFSCLLVIVFILELSAGIAGYALRDQTNDLIHSSLSSSIKLYGQKDHRDITILWDGMQTDFDCCGIVGQQDWPPEGTPLSCCRIPYGAVHNITCDATSKDMLRTTGCVKAFGNFISDHAVSLGAAGIAIAVVQFIGIFLACYIAKKIKEQGHSGMGI